MKGWLSIDNSQAHMLENAGWKAETYFDAEGNFDVSIPLNMIFGFAEDYQKIVVNMKHELVLVRSRNDTNVVFQDNIAAADAAPAYEPFKLVINRIEWLMPYVTPSDKFKINLINFVGKDRPVDMSFRTWELFEYPQLPQTKSHVWTVKTSNQLEKPRFVILGFQTDRKDQVSKSASNFDHCNISNVRLYLNSQYYPYGNLNIDMNKNQFSLLYDMYTQFQNSYYNKDSKPMLKKDIFKNAITLIVIDCSKQDETLKNAPVDIRLEFEARENFPANTAAYCLILHDRIVQYNPMSGDVRKLI